jgi:pimeloyl-ACP methyl ester carboxylesterase
MAKMPRLLFSVLAVLVGSAAYAQDFAGQWQGTITSGSQDLRVIVRLSKTDAGGWTGAVYRIDEFAIAFPINSVTLENATLKFSAPRNSYEGKISAGGTAMNGTLTDGQLFPLELRRATPETAWPTDPSPHTVQFVTVEKDVKLEVLDWGGSGRPLVLLAGLGDTPHTFDRFALKLNGTYHVYGITRRGFGASSAPDSRVFTADRLGDDVLAVLDALKLNKPVLVGHSIAGGELSSIGSRHPERVAGLIYLDAAYGWAFYDPAHGDFDVDKNELKKKLDETLASGYSGKILQELLDTMLPNFTRDLREELLNQDAMPPAVLASQYVPITGPSAAVLAGTQKYTRIPVPALAIYALPHDLNGGPPMDPAQRAAYEARDEITTGAQAKAFEDGVPTARVVRLPHARHYVFRSNEADVLREINAFIAGLP